MLQHVRRIVPGFGFALIAAAAGPAFGAFNNNSAYDQAVNALNPVAWYQFNDPSTANGSTATNSGSGGATNNATYNVGTGSGIAPGASAPGTGDPSRSFSGNPGSTANTASLSASDAGLPAARSARTVVAWVKTTEATTTGYPSFVSYGTQSTNSYFSVLLPNDSDPNFNTPKTGNTGVSGELGFSGYGDGVGGVTKITDGNWHFITVTAAPDATTGINIRLYVDGNLEGTVYSNGAPVTPPADRIGDSTVLSGANGLNIGSVFGQYTGLLAEPAIFGQQLSDAQVLGLYNSAVPEPASFGILSLGGLFLLRRRAARAGR